MTDQPLISVVVPVYNVEAYVRKCLDSIINQTYENLQIIVVDDGSTDASGSICDEYLAIDSRVEVLHISNSGLSGARNRGMQEVHGDYVAFVDSDDFIGRDHISNLFHAIEAHPQAKLAITGRTRFFEDRTEGLPAHSHPTTVHALSCIDALKIGISPLSNSEFGEYAWGKLYSKDLFEYLRYPVGKHYEDRYIYYRIVLNAGEVAYENANDYFYLRKRSDSITNLLSEKRFDCIEATRGMIPYIREHAPEAYDFVMMRYASELIDNFGLATKMGLKGRADGFYQEMKTMRLSVLKSPSMPLSSKLGYLVSCLGKRPLLFAIRINERFLLPPEED